MIRPSLRLAPRGGLRSSGVRALAAFASTLALSAACSSSDAAAPATEAPFEVPEGCQPLYGAKVCLAPFPSDFFRVADPSTRTGARLAIAGKAKPVTVNGVDADMTAYRTYDGFSLQPTIVATLEGAVAADGLPRLVGEGAGATSPGAATVLLEADTGALVPHYTDVNLDVGDGTVTPYGTPLVLRPFVQLKPRTRYVVAVQGAKRPTGELATAPEGFRRLREKVAGPAAIDAVAPRYETDVFAPLERAGVARAGLQLAWDSRRAARRSPRPTCSRCAGSPARGSPRTRPASRSPP